MLRVILFFALFLPVFLHADIGAGGMTCADVYRSCNADGLSYDDCMRRMEHYEAFSLTAVKPAAPPPGAPGTTLPAGSAVSAPALDDSTLLSGGSGSGLPTPPPPTGPSNGPSL